jgi:DNA-binding XRE family transcriptional regulator
LYDGRTRNCYAPQPYEENPEDARERIKTRKETYKGVKEMKASAKKTTKPLTHKQMVSKMLKKPAVKAEVNKLNREEFAILDQILAARKEAGLSQAQIAKRMGTQAPAIARLENALATGKHSPSLNTLRKYAAALGKRVELHLV